jgi:hypothetical protein
MNTPDTHACEVPLQEQLRSVKYTDRVEVEISPTHHRNVPYGAMCHQAATKIDMLLTIITQLNYNLQEAYTAGWMAGSSGDGMDITDKTKMALHDWNNSKWQKNYGPNQTPSR